MQFKKGPDKESVMSCKRSQGIDNALRAASYQLESNLKPVNLDPIHTGGVLRLELEGKLVVNDNQILVVDSNPTIFLKGFSRQTEDIQKRVEKL